MGGKAVATGKDRQKQLAREHYERQMQRRIEREQKAKRTAIIGS
ncbi:MAG: peptidylprolyl isomerase, partial [Nonomuraea sp.]|nr:peptidylprolyl isomerase [Nonomuraea sp.]